MRLLVLTVLLFVAGCCCDSNSSSGGRRPVVARVATLVLTADDQPELQVTIVARSTLPADGKFDYASWNLDWAIDVEGERYIAKPNYARTKAWPVMSMASQASRDWVAIGEWQVIDRQTSQASQVTASGMWYPDQLKLAVRYEVRNGSASTFSHVLDLSGEAGSQPVAKYDLRRNALVLSTNSPQ